MLEWATLDPLNGTQLRGKRAADNLGYVMIDDGPNYPYGAYVYTPGFGAVTTETMAPPTKSDKQLVHELYRRNKGTFWIAGSAIGYLTLRGLLSFFK